MKVCIIGAGVVGSYLAKKLSRENHEIAVIDVDSAKVEQLSYSYDILGLPCNALDVNCLKRVEDFDLFIVVTENEEKNVAIAVLLKAVFNKENVILRVSNKAFSSPPVRDFLKVDTVNVFSEITQTVLSIVKYPFALSTVKLENEELIIFKYLVKVEDSLAGKQIQELGETRNKVEFTIVAIEREGKIIIPRGESFIYPDDKIYVAVNEGKIKSLVEELGINYSPIKSVFVLGYSKLTEELLSKLSQFKEVNLKFVSPQKEICDLVSGLFPSITVFHGELTDVELLKSENIQNSDLVISLTDDEEANILSCILAKNLGAKKACALVFHPEYEVLVESIGIDAPIVPRKLLASKVYKKLSKKGVLDIAEISEDIDIVEVEVDSSLSGRKISEAKLKSCRLIIAVKKGEKLFIAKGDTVLENGDKLICIGKKG
ncbi:TrkA-N domain protein [Desulfurobacterium thermolithotrophum DSM 11699]|uniref:Trk system potassium uptake protein TrkA n=1 Tax=Desulfurobacterium thermolithotrophum (strain DSM 11699 / BSA) TaxID=868864 RepID=F0S158_DESTD|nr:NAD-binding protein [Desulfurobacterium thermolithotrophum]ADY73936.1 TrkA-N domain protein [Desulfurobacterium thermolithotrophum DSM 11699]